MSTNFVHAVPRDPFFVPSTSAEDEAREYFASVMIEGQEATSRVVSPMHFVHGVENSGDFACPRCDREVEWDWIFRLLNQPMPEVTMPCCTSEVSLGELVSTTGERFCRFYLSIRDPDAWDTPDEVLRQLEAILGTPMATVTQRL